MQLATLEQSSILKLACAKVEKNGLVIKEGLEPKEWIDGVVKPLRDLIDTMHGSALWWWGDALAYGERKYGEMYTQALEQSDYNYGTLRNAKLVSERIELSRRHDNLSWSHHAEVALTIEDKNERTQWLKRAEKEGLSKSDLRKAIRISKSGRESQDPPNTDAGQFSAITAAKQLRTFFEHEDVKGWDKERCSLWMNDLQPIAAAYEIMCKVVAA